MFCTACGAKGSGGRFCGTCGAPAVVDVAAPPTVATLDPSQHRSITTTATPAPGGPSRAATTGGLSFSKIPFPWDYGRDLGAAAVLIWSLTLQWSNSGVASGVVYVLLATLCAVFSLAVLPLSKLLRGPDGSLVR